LRIKTYWRRRRRTSKEVKNFGTRKQEERQQNLQSINKQLEIRKKRLERSLQQLSKQDKPVIRR
jgi:hypothetical protein